MKWIASINCPPLYVWEYDMWYNETDKEIYVADLQKLKWIGFYNNIPFPKKTRVLS